LVIAPILWFQAGVINCKSSQPQRLHYKQRMRLTEPMNSMSTQSAHFASLDQLKSAGPDALGKGALAILLAEDETEVDSTIRHNLSLGFGAIILLAGARLSIPEVLAKRVVRVDFDFGGDFDWAEAITAIIGLCPDRWIYYGFNAEYLFYPFCETRSISEMLAFHTEERRDAMFGTVVDLYAADLAENPDAVALEDAWFDGSAYFSRNREDSEHQPLDRQVEIFGGLRWRFEDDVPHTRRRIDRIPIFRAKPGLRLTNEHLTNDHEMNTVSCPWHNNITVAIASFRTAKALRANTAATQTIPTFCWQNSVAFEWHSKQLLDLGFIEPGQWF
jgi:hypothetical protein